jgi:hypothetical protein
MSGDAFSRDIDSATFSPCLEFTNDFKVSQSPSVPGLVPGSIVVCGKEVSVQDLFGIPLISFMSAVSDKNKDINPHSTPVFTELSLPFTLFVIAPCEEFRQLIELLFRN